MSKKIYCRECRYISKDIVFCTPFYDDMCRHTSSAVIEDTWLEEHIVYEKCSVRNAKNDCSDFEPKPIPARKDPWYMRIFRRANIV